MLGSGIEKVSELFFDLEFAVVKSRVQPTTDDLNLFMVGKLIM